MGALSFYVSTRYERNQAARKACINAHGTSYIVCGFNFEQSYGEHGKDFIHVHHLRPLYQASCGNRTDPIKDLVPVCPNCHYMLHRGNQLLTPEELKLIMKRK
nr:HNH endonuclease [uncultured Jannaschia sp.]